MNRAQIIDTPSRDPWTVLEAIRDQATRHHQLVGSDTRELLLRDLKFIVEMVDGCLAYRPVQRFQCPACACQAFVDVHLIDPSGRQIEASLEDPRYACAKCGALFTRMLRSDVDQTPAV